jgi:hypothetical protein
MKEEQGNQHCLCEQGTPDDEIIMLVLAGIAFLKCYDLPELMIIIV